MCSSSTVNRTGKRLLAMTRGWCRELRASVVAPVGAKQAPTTYASAVLRGIGIIGNCAFNALVKDGSVEWMCWPRPDSSFVFGPLLDREKGGAFVIEGLDATDVRQEY